MSTKLRITPSAKDLLVYGLLAAVILIPRMFGLDEFVTVDEPVWTSHSANFYYALGERDFKNTFQEYHPGVTTMWAGTAALLVYFREYRGLDQGQLTAIDFNNYLLFYGKDPLTLLQYGRAFSIAAITVILLISFWVAKRLVGLYTALGIILFIAFDPYYFGHSRLMNHEGMFSALILLSILGYLGYLYRGRQPVYLVISGAAGGLACLTKSPGIILIPFAGLLTLLDVPFRSNEGTRREKLALVIKQHVLPYGAWLLILGFVFYALWPAMWVAPLDTLNQIFGRAVGYVTSGTTTADFTFSIGFLQLTPMRFLNNLLSHTTAAHWIGVFLAVIFLIPLYRNKGAEDFNFRLITRFGLFAMLFLLMMSASQARQSPHYIMSTFLSIDLIAALGFATLIDRLRKARSQQYLRIIPLIVVAGILFVQAFFLIRWYPYYYNFSNPLIGAGRQRAGYGEGLDLAAKYLSQKPNAENLKAMSWYPVGPFSYFFSGQTYPIYVSSVWDESMAERLRQSDYLVVYIRQNRRKETRALLKAIGDLPPEHTVLFNEIEYAKIYRVSDFPEEVFLAGR